MAGMNIYPFLGMFKNGLNEEIIKQTGGLDDEGDEDRVVSAVLMVLKRWSLI